MNRVALVTGASGDRESDCGGAGGGGTCCLYQLPDAPAEAETLAEKSGTTVEMPSRFRRMWRIGRLWRRWSAPRKRSWVP
ncbi:MAG: hypothetical protein ACLTYN_03185 [Dysosmobacter welbionis]